MLARRREDAVAAVAALPYSPPASVACSSEPSALGVVGVVGVDAAVELKILPRRPAESGCRVPEGGCGGG